MMILIATLLLAYLIGSIPFGLILTRMAGLGDIRKVGSGNIGATNVLRAGGKKLGALTLLLDGLKGFLAVFLFMTATFFFAPQLFCFDDPHCSTLYIIGLPVIAATAGHIFPIWLRFKGGKGVATFLGCVLAPPFTMMGLICIILWLSVFLIFRISSLAALVALWVGVIGTLVYSYHITPLYWPGELIGIKLIAAQLLVVIFVITWRHKDNIKRLLAGTEPKFGKKP